MPAPSAHAAAAGDACVNHPDVTTGLVTCRRCGRRFCPDCVIALHGAFFCLDCKGEQVRDIQSGTIEQRLSVMDCIGMGWDVITGDFWPVWVVGLVYMAISFGLGVIANLPYIGIVINLATSIFVSPPLFAGLLHAVLRKIDGAPAEVGDLFEGFRSRYWTSILVTVPVWGIALAGAAVMLAGVFGFMALSRSMDAQSRETLQAVGIGLLIVVALIAMLIAVFVQSALTFAYVEMWDGPTDGWPAFVSGLRVARDNLWSVLGMAIMLGLLGIAAVLAGVLAVCIGLVVTLPFITMWNAVTHSYAYRSWSRFGPTRA